MQELLRGTLMFVFTVLPVAGVMMVLRRFCRVPDELFRKILHFILLGAYFPVLYGFDHWWMADLFLVLLMIAVYPLLAAAGRIPAFTAFVNERKGGEFKSSMVLALTTMACAIAICWGLLNDKLLVLACVYAWGVGDGFAALVGKRYGKHKVRLKWADRRKSVEGSTAMFLCAVVSVFTVLLVRGGLPAGSCLVIALAAAAATTLVEMCTKGGNDTVTCPAAAMAVILPLAHLMGG